MVTQLQPDVRAYLHGGEVIKRYIKVEEVAYEYGFSVEEVSLSALRQAVIISRQVEAVIVIFINHIREVVHPIAVHHIAINRRVVLLRVVQVTLVQAVVTIINQIQQIIHHIVAAQRKAQRQRRVHMTLMMMAMMISIWMAIMTMTDMTETAIMLMV